MSSTLPSVAIAHLVAFTPSFFSFYRAPFIRSGRVRIVNQTFLIRSYNFTMKLPLTIAILATQAAAVLASTCYCLPGDSCWPSDSTWASLNDTVGGRLIATVPLGSPCHDPNYNATACAALQSAWTEPETQYVCCFSSLLVVNCIGLSCIISG